MSCHTPWSSSVPLYVFPKVKGDLNLWNSNITHGSSINVKCPCVSVMSPSHLLLDNSCCINKNFLFSWFPSLKPTQKIIQKTFCSWSLVFTKNYHVLCVLSNFFVQKDLVALTIALWKYIHPRVLSRIITYDLSKLLKLFPNPWPMNINEAQNLCGNAPLSRRIVTIIYSWKG